MTDEVHEVVRDRYAKSALAVMSTGITCCTGEAGIGAERYSALERDTLPDAAVLASLGCGNPTAVADLHEGDRVLDLGSGGGIDVLLSARRVGPTGRAIGLDMTDEMLALAQRNAAEAGATNVEFLKGHIEAIPMPADSVDAIISNCVVNLAADKPAVFREIARVLRPGGRIGISDIVAEDGLTTEQRAERGSYVGCIAGALSFSEFEAGLVAVGLSDVSVTPTHAVADGMHSAIIRATKPLAAPRATEPSPSSAEPVEPRPPSQDAIRVLFVCTGNSARSQMAEALLTDIGGSDFAASSAGTEPTGVNPLAIAALAHVGIDWSAARSKSVSEFLGQPFDYVITVCDRARQSCPAFPGGRATLHWGLDDPAEVEGTDAEKRAAFERTAMEVSIRLRPFVELARRARRTTAEV